MTRRTSNRSSNRKPPTPSAPTALKLAPGRKYGSSEPWYMGVVLQQACQAMVRRGA